MSLNVRPYDNQTLLLFPPSVGDYLPEDHLAHVVDEVVGQLDLTGLYNLISPVGPPAYHPALMVKVWFYGYATGVTSSRKLARGLETDVAFIYLSGMQRPDFRTLCDFRKDHLEELKGLFVQIVRLCRELGMVSLGHWALDSTVIKANASREATYGAERLEREEREIEEAIEGYLRQAEATDREEDEVYGPKQRGDEMSGGLRSRQRRLEKIRRALVELPARKPSERRGERTINLTDSDAAFQRLGGRVVPGYRGGVVVDGQEQVIIAAEAASGSDQDQLMPLVDEALETVGEEEPLAERSEKIILSADSGYSSGRNLAGLEERKRIDPYIPDGGLQAQERGKGAREASPFHKNRFEYHSEGDCYACPLGKRLALWMTTTGHGGQRIFLYRCREGQRCPERRACTRRAIGRVLKVSEHDQRLRAMRQKLRTAEGRRRYNRRKTIVEPVFGQLKQNLKLREFLLRGLRKVQGEFSLWATAHNLLKITRFLRRLGRNRWEAWFGSPRSGVVLDPGG